MKTGIAWLVASALLGACSTRPAPVHYAGSSTESNPSRYRTLAGLQAYVAEQTPEFKRLHHPRIVAGVRMQKALDVEPAPENGAPELVPILLAEEGTPLVPVTPAAEVDRLSIRAARNPVQTGNGTTLLSGEGISVQSAEAGIDQYTGGHGGASYPAGELAGGVLQVAAGCVLYLGIICPFALPVLLPMTVVAYGVSEQVKHRRARQSSVEIAAVIPEEEAARLASLLVARPTAVDLSHYTSALLLGAENDDAPADGAVILHIEAVEFREAKPWLLMRVTAQAQAVYGDGTASPVTRHVSQWRYGPVWRWTRDDDAAVEQGLEQSLARLGENILTTYVHGLQPPGEEAESSNLPLSDHRTH